MGQNWCNRLACGVKMDQDVVLNVEMNEELTIKQRELVSPIFQVAFILLTAVSLCAMFGYRFYFFKSRDPVVQCETISPQKFKEFGAYSNEVGVGLQIDAFETFDIVKNEIVFAGQVWFSMIPGSISLDTLEKFYFSRGEIIFKSQPYLFVEEEKLFVIYRLRVKMSTYLNLVDFPVNNHTICIQLDHPYVNPNELLFEPRLDNFTINGELKPFGWTLFDKRVKSGFLMRISENVENKNTGYYPTVLFYFDIMRYGTQYALTIFLPLILIFFVILFCFSVVENSISFSLAVGGVTTILAYRFVIANISPQVGYFMMTDYLFLLLLAGGVIVFLTHVNDVFYKQFISIKIKKCIVIGMHFMINALSWYLLYW